LIELDIQILKNSFPEPGDVLSGTSHQLINCWQAVPIHKTLEPASFDVFVAGSPNYLLIKWKLRF
jgi:hypothetical protein